MKHTNFNTAIPMSQWNKFKKNMVNIGISVCGIGLLAIAVSSIYITEAKDGRIATLRNEQAKIDTQILEQKKIYFHLDAQRSQIEEQIKKAQSKADELRTSKNAKEQEIEGILNQTSENKNTNGF